MQQTEITLKLNFNEDIRRIRLIERNYESLQKQIKQIYSIDGSFSLKYKDDEGDQVTISSQQELEEALNCIRNNLLHLRISKAIENEREDGKGWRCHKFREWRENCKRWGNNKQNEEKIENIKSNENHPHPHFQHFKHPSQHFRHPFHHRHPHPHFQHPSQKDENDSSFHHLPNHFPRHPFGFFHKLKEIAKNFICQQSESDSSDSLIENFLNSGFCKLEHNHICDGCDVRISGTRYHCTECEDFDFCSDCFENKIKTHPLHKFEKITALEALKQALQNGQQIDSFFIFGSDANEDNLEKVDKEKEKLEQEIIEQEKEKIVKEKLEKLEKEKLEKEKLEKEKLEKEKEKLEKEKLEKKLEKVQQEKIDEPVNNEIISSPPKDVLFPLRNESDHSSIVYSFENKLQDLQLMGFTDRKKNIVALVQNKGDLHLAIEQLLNQN